MCEFDGRFVLVELVFVVLFFVWLVSMPLIVILTVMIFLFVVSMLLTLPFLLFCAATSTRSLIVLLIIAVLVLLMFLCPFSDHCALSFSWVLPDSVPMGPGLWKLNLAILEEDEYVSLITDCWLYWQRCQSGFSTLTRWWDPGKSHIKRLSINI